MSGTPRTGAAAVVSDALLAALGEPATYATGAVELRETHASWVFLAGEDAYKVKKPVRLAFLDYSTLARRRAACREEVRVNRELAPGVYLGVLAIVRTSGGFRLAPEGARGAVEYVVHMRRFDEANTLQGAIRARTLRPAQLVDVARLLADFHRRTPQVAGGMPLDVLDAWRTNLDELARLAHPRSWRLQAMSTFGEAFVGAHAKELERRAREGHVRDGHGDLRCEHVLLGPPLAIIDRIEFDPALRHMDVAGDLAFLTMDLEARGRRGAARELAAAYRRAGASPGSEELRSFYGAYWALVRAKVALIAATGSARRAGEHDRERARAGRLWRLAERLCWRARRPLVIVVCGPAASGKSTLAAELAHRAQLPIVSSDVVRKHLAGLPPAARARAEHYTREFTHRTYDALSREALDRLDLAGGVIVDASCQRRAQRALLLRRLRSPSATFLVVHCRVTLETALARAAARMQGTTRVSDATPEIVAQQFHSFQALEELPARSTLVLDAEAAMGVQLERVARALDERLRASRRAPGAGAGAGAGTQERYPGGARAAVRQSAATRGSTSSEQRAWRSRYSEVLPSTSRLTGP